MNTRKVTTCRAASILDRLADLRAMARPAALLTCIALVSGFASAASAAPQPSAFVGAAPSAVSDIDAYGTWSNHPNVWASDNGSFSGGWADIENPSWILNSWPAWVSAQPGRKLMIALPMVPDDGSTLASVASGAHDASFAGFATRLQNSSLNSSIIRIGWEMNGNWFPWSANPANPNEWINAYRRIHTVMKAIAPNLKFCWNTNHGTMTTSPDLLWPGDNYVDYVGMDHYDVDGAYPSGQQATPAQQNAGWANHLSKPHGLNWLASFAATHNKPIIFPEWGLWGFNNNAGGGDNPIYIQNMYDWMNSHNVFMQTYFDFNFGANIHRLWPGANNSYTTTYPLAKAKFLQTFGSTAADTTVTFQDLSDGVTLSNYAGISWSAANGGWRIWDGGAQYTLAAYVNSTATSEVVTTFTLPAGQVLKSLKVSGSGTAPATLKVSSPGNPERVWTDVNASVQLKNLNWTTAASTVTVKITCASQWGASDLGFDDLVYGSPSAPPANAPPSVAVAAAANPTPVTGTQSTLSVLGADDGGEAALTYTWSVASAPAGAAVGFSTNGSNAAKNTVATFSHVGTYSLTATIRDAANATATSTVALTVQQPNMHGGTWAVRGVMPSTPSWKKLIAYDTNVSANTSYTARIWVKGTGKVQLLIRNSNWSATLASVNITGTGSWQQASVAFNSGSNSVVHYTLYDAVGGTAGTLYLDDASLSLSSGGANLIANPGFESGGANWIVESGAPFTIMQNP